MTDTPKSMATDLSRANHPSVLLLTDAELVTWAAATAAMLRPMSAANAVQSEIWEVLSARYSAFELAAAEHAKGRKEIATLIKETLSRSGVVAFGNHWLSFKSGSSNRTNWKALLIDHPEIDPAPYTAVVRRTQLTPRQP